MSTHCLSLCLYRAQYKEKILCDLYLSAQLVPNLTFPNLPRISTGVHQNYIHQTNVRKSVENFDSFLEQEIFHEKRYETVII